MTTASAAASTLGQPDALTLVAVLAERRHLRIMIVHVRPALFEQADHVERRTLPHVVDVFLVCDAQDEDAASVYRFPSSFNAVATFRPRSVASR